MEKQNTLKAIQRERKNILNGVYPLMSKELKQRTLNLLEEAEKRINKNRGLMVLLNDSFRFKGGNVEVIAKNLGIIIKDKNSFENQTGDRLNYIYKENN